MTLTRREFVGGLASACLLCGCRSGESPLPATPPAADPPPAEPPATPDPAPSPSAWTIDIPDGCHALDGQAKISLEGAGDILVWRDRAGYHAIEATCTHRGGEVFYDPEARLIWCSSHGSKFFFDGSVACGPATEPLAAFRVTESGGRLEVTRTSR